LSEKAEVTGGDANPRFVVTSLKSTEIAAQHLYEAIYCARGDMENRIKECQLDLFADRTSAATMRANQLRLWFASMAYVLLCALRRIGLAHSQFADATCGTIRLKLLKIGALVRVSVRRIKVAMSSACPWQNEFALAHVRLRHAAAWHEPDIAQSTYIPTTLPDWRCCSCATQPSPQTSARPFSPYRACSLPTPCSTLRRYENSGLL